MHTLMRTHTHTHTHNFQFRCCGVVNYTDYFTYDISPNNHSVPMSCCNTNDADDCAAVTSDVTDFVVQNELIYLEVSLVLLIAFVNGTDVHTHACIVFPQIKTTSE